MSPTPRLVEVGERAVLVELQSGPEAAALAATLLAHPPAGADDIVVGAVTVLVTFDPTRTTGGQLRRSIEATSSQRPPLFSGTPVELPTIYDGPDLEWVADHAGLSSEEVIRRHTEARYTVAFLGFAPGFAYLTGGDPRLRVPRRSSPRTTVAPGSVALADEYTGIYPRSSPGGWQLIGRTEIPLWDLGSRPPSVLTPGAEVRFRALDAATPPT